MKDVWHEVLRDNMRVLNGVYFIDTAIETVRMYKRRYKNENIEV